MKGVTLNLYMWDVKQSAYRTTQFQTLLKVFSLSLIYKLPYRLYIHEVSVQLLLQQTPPMFNNTSLFKQGITQYK